MKIVLNYPIKSGAATISEIELRRPKVRDIRAGDLARASGGDTAAMVAMIASMTGLPTEAVEDIDVTDDFARIVEAFNAIAGDARPLPNGGA